MVRQRDSGQIFAMKMLHKWEMLKRAEVSLGSDGALALSRWAGEASTSKEALGMPWKGEGRERPEQAENLPPTAATFPIPSLQ